MTNTNKHRSLSIEIALPIDPSAPGRVQVRQIPACDDLDSGSLPVPDAPSAPIVPAPPVLPGASIRRPLPAAPIPARSPVPAWKNWLIVVLVGLLVVVVLTYHSGTPQSQAEGEGTRDSMAVASSKDAPRTDSARTPVVVDTVRTSSSGRPADSRSMTDPRDGMTYETVKIGNQVWMAQNLNHKMANSRCYDDKPSNCLKFGRLYRWESARRACPDGWHLASDAEWKWLERTAGMNASEANKQGMRSTRGEGRRLMSSKMGGEDEFGFHVLPGGLGDRTDNSFHLLDTATIFWTATNPEPDSAWIRGFARGQPQAGRRKVPTSLADLSIRCVEDASP